MARDLLRLLRPKQWAKNLLVFAALLFTGRALSGDGLGAALVAFAAMSLAASATYVANDVRDAERDRAHPKKRLRPVASGRVGPRLASGIAMGLAVVGLGLAFILNRASGVVVGLYLLLQVAYNLGLKRTPVADVFAIAAGFVLRAVLSATAIDARVSVWLLLCTGSLALMLGFAKRRSEFVSQGEARGTSRESLTGYSLPALDAMVVLFAGAAVVTYLLYSIDSKTGRAHPLLIGTAVFVTYGVARYLLLVFAEGEGGEPEELLFRDPHLIFTVVGFVLAAAAALTSGGAAILER